MEYYDRSRSYDRFDGLDNFFDFVDFLDYVDEQYDDEWESETEDYSLYETVEALQSSKIMIPRRIMRDATNPLESFSDEQFRRTFRFSKDTVVGEVFPLLNLQNPENERGLPVPPALQLLTALKFYGACGFQADCCDDFGISQSTVSRIVTRVSIRLAETFPQFVKFPTEPDQVATIRSDFYKIAHFSDVVGCISCTHIPILSPGGSSAQMFRNKRGYVSLNVQVVVGPTMIIQDFVCRWPGATPNSQIFKNSAVKARLKSGHCPGIVLGDDSYPQRPYLFVPVLNDVPLTPAQQRYNEAHRQTHSVTKSFFTAWKQRFPCLQQKLRCKLMTSATIIVACAVLHNIGRACNDSVDGIQVQDYEAVPVETCFEVHQQGIKIREDFIQKHFSEKGQCS